MHYSFIQSRTGTSRRILQLNQILESEQKKYAVKTNLECIALEFYTKYQWEKRILQLNQILKTVSAKKEPTNKNRRE
jgi:predicted nucleic-acid-binding Zn-ribbon protein